jgi:AcrR family transcriptional regulator
MPRPADPLARPKLLRAAREVFADVGLSEARIEDITRRAGVSKGAFYLHFKSKEAVFETLLDGFLMEVARFADLCAPNLAQATCGADVERFFRAQDAQMLEFLWAHRDILGVFYQAGATPQYQHVLNAFLDAQAEHVGAQLRALQARGLYRRSLDAAIVATAIVGVYHNLTRHLVQQRGRPDFAHYADTIVSLLTGGLLEPTPVAPEPDPSVNDHPVNSSPGEA